MKSLNVSAYIHEKVSHGITSRPATLREQLQSMTIDALQLRYKEEMDKPLDCDFVITLESYKEHAKR